MTADVEFPLPLPDVPGADVGSRGLPDRSELTLLQRVVVDAELAALLATEATQKEEARAAIEQVRQLRQENKLAPIIR